MHPLVILFWGICIACWLAWLGLAFKSNLQGNVRRDVLLAALCSTGVATYATLVSQLPT